MKDILDKLYVLTHRKGFIYSLILIIRRDQFVSISEYGIMNSRDRLLADEIGLLLRYWIINNDNPFDIPDSLEEISQMKHDAIDLLESLHCSFIKPVAWPDYNVSTDGWKRAFEESFSKTSRLKEAIFYGGDSIYDFEYLDYIAEKYKYDAAWLKINKGYIPEEVIAITRAIKDRIDEKNKCFPGINEATRYQLEHPESGNENFVFNDFFEYLVEFNQDIISDEQEKRLDPLKTFCNKLLSLFCIDESEIYSFPGYGAYLRNFSFDLTGGFSEQYDGPGYYNVLTSRPLIKISRTTYFVPVVYWIFMAAYESPYYWMMNDSGYKYEAGSHRGHASEDIVYNILKPVFGDDLYRDIVIKGARKKDQTDIDILAVVGSVAICFQIKSKKLTEASKLGDLESITSDFGKAVVTAYNQGKTCGQYILNPEGITFFNREGNSPFNLPLGIEDVYIVCLTSENYPALPTQVRELTCTNNDEQPPIAFSVFDLRLIAHYLNSPYDFAYYIRQRIETADYYYASTEMCFLGYHLRRKLWRDPQRGMVLIDDEFASEIDQNYYPFLAGIDVDPDIVNDRIANRWRNESFEKFWGQIAQHKDPRRTRIIFDLFDLSGDAADNLMSMIKQTEERVKVSGNRVALSTVFDGEPARWGLSYVICPPSFNTPLRLDMEAVCTVRKYEYHADKWIVIGRMLNSPLMVDAILVDTNPWVYNAEMETAVKEYNASSERNQIITNKKVGRNDPCPCGSGKKFKNCHGR